MRIPGDYRFTSAIKDKKNSIPRKRKIEKVRKEEFSEELESIMFQKESKEKKVNFSYLDV